jgi:hypothetical protein
MNLTAAMYERLAGDATLVGLLASYRDGPAIFTTDPAPGDATLPYIVTAGEVAQRPFEAKNARGREIFRDVRCYAPASGTAAPVEAIAEQVRVRLHRHALVVDGGMTLVAEATGPIVADEVDAYGRIVSLRLVVMES